MSIALNPTRFPEEEVFSALSASGVGLWRWTAADGQIAGNAQFDVLHGLASSGSGGTSTAYGESIHADDRDRVFDAMRQALRLRTFFCAEYRLAGDKVVRWVEATGSVLLARSAAVGLAGLCRDVTERKRIEDELGRRTLQQEAALRLGTLALNAPTVQGLLEAMSAQIRDALGAKSCRVFELRASGEELAFRAGAGRDANLTPARTATNEDSDAALALTANGTVLVGDLDVEQRLPLPDYLKQRGIRSRALVRIDGEEGRPFGILAVNSTRPHSFSRADADFLEGVADQITGAIRRVGDSQRQRFLVRELRHRIGNLLTLIFALFKNSVRGATSIDDVSEKFTPRLLALSRAHIFLSYGGWTTAGLAEVVDEVLEPFLDLVEINGANIRITATAAFALSLMLGELVTNAAKFGALAAPGGRIALDWGIDREDGAEMLQLRWIEAGLARIQMPDSTGFGSRLLRAVTEDQFGGKLAITYAPFGVNVEMRLPLDRLTERSEVEAGAEPSAPRQ